MSLLNKAFQDQYSEFFKFFADSNKNISEMNSYINTISPLVSSPDNFRFNINIIDNKNLNILFHVIRKSKTDEECLEKIKFLIESCGVNYEIFDINKRTLPYYSCVKGFFNTTVYLIDKMNFNIALKDNKEETLFFSALRSFNIKLINYLDQKYRGWVYYPNASYETCIFNIFKKSIKDEGETNIKNILKFIVSKGFDVSLKNVNKITFKELCKTFGIDKYLDEVMNEYNINLNEDVKENKNQIKSDGSNVVNDIDYDNLANNSFNNSKSSKINNDNTKKEKVKDLKKKDDNINVVNQENNDKGKEKKKVICCFFINKKCDISINLIKEKMSKSKLLKQKYLDRINNLLQIPSFEKGDINVIKKTLSKEK